MPQPTKLPPTKEEISAAMGVLSRMPSEKKAAARRLNALKGTAHRVANATPCDCGGTGAGATGHRRTCPVYMRIKTAESRAAKNSLKIVV